MAETYSVQAQLSAVDKNFSSAFENAQNVANKLGKTLTITGAVTTAFGIKALNSFGDFEASLNKAAVTAGGTAKDIDGLADVANKMGAALPLSAQDSADAMVEMAQAGLDVSKIKQYFPAIAEAATAAGADVKVTASTVQNAMNIWGSSLKSPQRAAAILVDTANLSNASMEDMSSALANVGGAAGNMGMSMQDTSVAIGLLTNRGFSAAQASQDLNHAIIQMQAPSSKAKEEMSALGLSFTDAQGNMKPFPTILEDVNKALDGLQPAQRAAALKTLFGTAGMGAMLPLLDSMKDKTGSATTSWNAFSDAVQRDSATAGTAGKFIEGQAAEMQKNVGSSLEQVKGNWDSLVNTSMQGAKGITSGYLGMINSALQWASASHSGVAEVIRGFIGLSPAIGVAVTAVGGFLSNVTKIGSSMKSLGTTLVSPWGLATVGIMGVIAVLGLAYSKSSALRSAVGNVGNAFSSAFSGRGGNAINIVVGGISKLAELIGNSLATVINAIPWQSVFNGMAAVIGVVSNAINKLIAMWRQLPQPMQSVIGKMIGFAGAAVAIAAPIKLVSILIGTLGTKAATVGSGTNVASSALKSLGSTTGSTGGLISGLLSKVGSLAASFSGVFSGAISGAGGLIGNLGAKMIEAGGKTGIAGVAVKGLGAAFTMVASPVGIVIAALTLVTAGLTLFGGNTQATIAKVQAFGQSFATIAPIIGQTFGTMIQSLGAMVLAAVPGVIIGITQMMAGIVTTVVTLAPTVVMGFAQMFLAISTAILAATPTLIMGMTNLLIAFTTIIVTMAPQVVASFVAILTAFTTAIASAMPQIIQDGVTLIVSFLQGIVSAIPQIVPAAINVVVTFLNTLASQMPQLISAGVNFVTSVMDGIAQNLPQLIESATNLIVTFLGGLTQNMPKLITAGIQFVVSVLNGIASNIGDLVTAGVNVVVKFIEGVANNLGNIINAAVDLIGKFVIGLANAIPRIADKAREAVMKFVYGVGYTLGQVLSSGHELINKFVQGVMKGMSSSRNSGKSNGNAVKSALQGFSFHGVGFNMMIGLANGIVQGGAQMVNAAVAAAGKALSAVKRKLGIASPSKVFKREVGIFIPAGMAIGIMKNIKTVEQASNSMVQAAIPDIDGKDIIPNLRAKDLSDSIASANASIDHQFNATANAELTLTAQPAQINLNLGNQNYKAFVNDITNQQNQDTQLEIKY
ncbi:phage tail tape measure protein [Fructilactobacillus sp. Tb1]|uniref:phage tail tape measure protein n=1 Tax=Fructilactobacillus sp. Tb1 TaxID=3422304 RepID=UPI003D28020D